MGGSADSLWSKIDAAVLPQVTATPSGSGEPSQTEPTERNWGRWRFRILDMVGTAIWIYAIAKLAVFDFDVFLIRRYAPGAQWILDLKFVIFLVVLAVWASLVRKWWFLAEVAYLIFFPFVVIFWKIPRLLYKRRPVVVAFATLDILTNLIRDYRFSLVTSAVSVVTAAVIAVSPEAWLILPAAIAWGILLFTFFLRSIWRSFNPSRFIRGQVILLDRAVESKGFAKLWCVNEDLRSPEITKFSSAQMTQFTSAMAMGVLTHRIMYWWAYQLESYRRSPAPFLINVLSFMRLFIVSVLAYSLINIALFHLDPHAFRYTSSPTAFDFFHYSLNTLIGGSIDSLTARSTWAVVMSDLAHVTGIILILALLTTLLFTIRSTKQDEILRETVSAFRHRARDFDKNFTQQYEINVADALSRLRELESSMVSIILFFSSRVPPDFESDQNAS